MSRSQTEFEPLLLDIRAAAALAGVPVSAIRRWTGDGLPHVRDGRGGRLFFRRRDLERYIERRIEVRE